MVGTVIPATIEHLTLTTDETTSDSHWLSQSVPICAVIDEWEVVEYAHFVNYPPIHHLHSNYPSLEPHSLNYRKRSTGGAWIQNPVDGGGASIKLVTNGSTGFNDAILIISICQSTLEEHCVSRLHFSWPQVSCVSGFPSRGTRAVFVSWKDGGGQIQKFALRFLTIHETDRFISVLKRILKDASPDSLPCAELGSEVSSRSEFIPSNSSKHKSAEEGWRCMDSMDSSTNQVLTSGQSDFALASHSREMILHSEAEEILSAFPPSFTSFLMNCCPASEIAAVKPTLSEDADIKHEIKKYLKDPSFQDVLAKAEQLITELGDDIAFQ